MRIILLVCVVISCLSQIEGFKVPKFASSLLAASAILYGSPAFGVGGSTTFTNTKEHYSVSYPSDWIVKDGQLSGERILKAFVNPKDASASVSIVYTPIPADFNRLSSFGDIESYLIPKGDGISTEVVSQSTKGETFTLEYISEAPELEQPKRHVITVFALRPQEAVIGLTAQSDAATFEASKPLFLDMVKSLKTNL